MTEKNIQILCGAKKKEKPDIRDFKFSAVAANKKVEKDLPKLVSLQGKFPPVYTQIYGNCTSNAVLAVDAYYHHGASRLWIPSTTFTYYYQRIMDKSGFLEDDGSSVETALKAVRKYGACSSKLWPNDFLWNMSPDERAVKDGLHGHELTKFYAVSTLLQIKKALACGYPVVCSMDWPFKDPDTDGIIETPSLQEIKECDLGHAIVIVGYNDILKDVIIRNSWGSLWGFNGYALIGYEALKRCIWWDDAYAVIK